MGILLAMLFLAVSAGLSLWDSPQPDRTVLAQIGLRVFGASNPLYWCLQSAPY